jgi:hypothetical protein
MSRKLVTMQIYVTEAVRERAKAVAKIQGKTLKEFTLELFAASGDNELKRLVEQELKESRKPGRPWDNK